MDFIYKAKTENGETKEGVIIAETEASAIGSLHKKSLYVLNIKQGHSSKRKSFFKKKVSLKDKIIFTRQLSIMVKGGLPLVSAIEALEEQTENKQFITEIRQIRMDVSGGLSLSKALDKHRKIFPEYYVAVVSSGEKSGKLDKVLESLADQLQKDYDLMSQVKAAVTYPVVIVCALILMLILMLVFVVPKLKDIFSSMGAQLPLPTRILLGTSDFMVSYWYIVVLGVVAIYFLIKSWVKTDGGRLAVDTFKIKVPIFGDLSKKIYLTRFSRTTATLIASGLPMLEVIATDKKVIDNKFYEPIFNSIGQDIENGVSLSAAIKKHHVFPAMISQMISVGEKSGKIDEILLRLADFFDKEIATTTSQLASLIEPLLILLIGAGIGVAISAVILPIYSLVNVI